MRMLSQKVLVFLIFSFVFASESNITDIISLILDFLDKQEAPTFINSYICWSRNDLLRFSDRLWNSNYRLRIITDTKEHIFSSHIRDHELVLVDMRCKNVDKIFEKDEDGSLFKQPSRWIAIGNVSDIISRNLNIGVDSKFFVFEEFGPNVHVYALFKYSKELEKFNSNRIATWSKEAGLKDYNHLTIGTNRTNLNGLPLKISYVITNQNSLKHLWDYREKHVDTISKLNYLLVHYLTDFINASTEFIIQPTWGYKQKNSTLYNGMLGDLQRGIAELGGTPSFFTYDRVAVVDYIAATYKTYMKFIFRSPPLSYISNIFTLPFDIYVWYSCLGILLLTLISIYLVMKWEYNDSFFKEHFTEDPQKTLKPSITDVILLEISAISQQGSSAEPKSLAGRIATIFIFAAVIFLYTSYSASIVVLLQSTTNSINSLEDLLSTRIALGVEDIVYAHYYFETTKEPTRKAVYDQKIAPNNQKPNFMTIHEGIKRVQNEFFGFHVELSSGYKVIGDFFKENEKCGLQEVTFVNLIEPWLPVRKDSSYKEIMKVGMRRIHEHGLQHREASKLYTKKPICNVNHGNFVNVGLRDCYFVFIIFGSGVSLSLMILILENIQLHYIKTRAKKISNTFKSFQ